MSGNFARTTKRILRCVLLSAMMTLLWVAYANAVPAGVLNLTAITGANDGNVALSWTAPGQSGMSCTVSSYLVKFATSRINSTDFFKTWVNTYQQNWVSFATGGSPEIRTLTGLNPGTILFFALKGVDVSQNYGVWYSSFEFSGINIANYGLVKIIAPGKITSIFACAGYKQIELNWIAPGDDDYSGEISGGMYEIRTSPTGPFVNETDWENVSAGYPYSISWSTSIVSSDAQSRIITGLNIGTSYYFAIKIRNDVAGNWSVLNTTAPVPFAIPYNTPPAVFNLQSPGNVSIVTTAQPEFDWDDTTNSDPGDWITL